MDKNYLVTGAAGFIGAAVAKRLMENGNRVTTIDNLSTGNKESVPDGVTFIEGDCQDVSTIAKLKNQYFDAIFHIAGQSSGEISFDDPVYDLQTNTQSTLLLLDYARDTKCNKFIYASTMSVYGDQPDEQITENHLTLPKSFYAIGKLASENYLRIYNAQYKLQTTSLRLFNIYGVGQNLKNMRQGMVSIFLAQAIKNNHILVKGSGDRFRDQVYIDDAVNAFISALEKNDSNYKYFNVCTGVKVYVKDVINKIVELLPNDISVEYSGSTPGDQFGIVGCPDKIKNVFKWEAKNTFAEGMDKMVEWAYKEYTY